MRTCCFLFGFLMLLALACAQPFTYQGYLRDGGTPANGTYDFRFRLFDSPTGGSPIAANQFADDLTVQNGLFTTAIDFGAVWDGADRYLEIAVRPGSSTGAYTILSPRVKITPTPYAVFANTAGEANPIGAAGGDLGGTYPNPTVARLQGRSVSNAVPGSGQVLKWSGTMWAPANDGLTLPFSGSANVGTSDSVISVTNTNLSGTSNGVFGQNDSTSGRGVSGKATATSGINNGVWGQSESTNGRGVMGLAFADSGTNYGVYGQTNSTSGYGVYAIGRFAATGTKAFQIDHPLQPETHFLNHFCTEAPEPLNAYSGNVVTDAKGYATVILPHYFEAVNRDFRYQLTVMGQFAQAIVAEKIRDNQFLIRTDKPNVEVSWEVKAIRNDRWIQQHGYQTEQDKPKEYQGKYLHPELFGQPKEKGIHHHPEPEPAKP